MLRFALFFFDFLNSIFRFLDVIILDFLNDFTSLVRKGVDDFNMISEGDRIAVGVSGGKDSLVLLRSLAHLQRYYPKRFELSALTIEPGFEDMDYGPVARLCEELDIPYTRIKTDIREIVFDVRHESSPCSLCSKMRRGALNDAINSMGFTKLALGHHADDVIETFMMSLIFEGRINCFRPVTFLDRSGVTQIRPMIYADEARIEKLAGRLSLPIVQNTCPEDRDSKRREIKELLAGLEQDYPDLKAKIFGAIKRMPLPGWETTARETH